MKRVNSAKLVITSSDIISMVKDEDHNRIIEVSYDIAGRSLSKGDPIYLKGEGWYRVNHIEKSNNNTTYITFFERSDTAIFLLPLIHNDRQWWSVDSQLVGAYDRIVDEPISESIYVVYRQALTESQEVMFTRRDHIFREHPMFKRNIDMPKGFSCYKFQIPSRYLNDLTAFRNSAFSQMSDDAKNAIISFNLSTRFVKKLETQLNRDEALRKSMESELQISIRPGSELRSAISIERESLDRKQFLFEI